MDNESKEMHSGDQDSRETQAAVMASQAVSEGLTKQGWSRVEQRSNPNQQKVLDSNIAYAHLVIKGSNATAAVETFDKKVLGAVFYPEIRDALLAHGIVTKKAKKVDQKDQKEEKAGKKEKKEKKVVVKKADTIRATNAIKTSQTVVSDVIKSYNWDNLTPQVGFRSHYIEIVGTAFMYMARFILKKRENFAKDKNISQVWSLMVSMQRFMDACANYIGTDPVNPGAKAPISQAFLTDMQDCYDDINVIFPFDGETICQRAPELMVSAPLDEHVPATSVQPRDHQKRIVEKTNENLKTNQPSAIVYNAMIGSGKTTAVSPLLEISKQYGKILLCVCNLETVREQMCNSFYNANQNFAVGYIRYDGKIKLSQTWSKKGGDIAAIVCGPEVAYRILTDKVKIDGLPDSDLEAEERFVLFHDEPTIGADDVYNASLRDNIKVLMNAPKWLIFSSATSPTLSELEPLLSRLRTRHAGLVVDTVYSPTVYVPCEVRTQSGDLVVPFLGCKTPVDIRQVIQKINDMPFLGRMLTPNVALHLFKELTALGAVGVPNIPVMFKKVSNLKADKIREIVLEMLEQLASQHPESIEKLCSSRLLDSEAVRISKKEKEVKKADEEDLGFEWESSEQEQDEKGSSTESTSRSLNFDQLGTGAIWKGMTLITDTDPVEFVLTHFQPLLDELSKAGIKSARRIIDLYARETAKWKTDMEKSLKNLAVSEIEKSIKENEMMDARPSAALPEWSQVGTIEYCKRFIPQKERAKVIDTRIPNNPESIIDVTGVRDELILLLMCGIGVYSPTHRTLDPYYNDIVLELASRGKMAYVASDISIVYGTNQPYGRAIPTDRFVKKHSIQVFFQMIARAGRVGKLAKAEAIVSEDTARILVDYTIHPERYSIEANNITTVVEFLEHEAQQAIDAEIARLEKEMVEEQSKTQTKTRPKKSVKDTQVDEFVTFNEFADIDVESTQIKITSIASVTPTLPVPKTKTVTQPAPVDEILDSWEMDDSVVENVMKQAPPLCTSSDGANPGRTSPPIIPISKVIERAAVQQKRTVDTVHASSTRQVPVQRQPQEDSQLAWRRQGPAPETQLSTQPSTRLLVESRVESKAPVVEKRYVPPAMRQRQEEVRSEQRSDPRQDSRPMNRDGDNWRTTQRSDPRQDSRPSDSRTESRGSTFGSYRPRDNTGPSGRWGSGGNSGNGGSSANGSTRSWRE